MMITRLRLCFAAVALISDPPGVSASPATRPIKTAANLPAVAVSPTISPTYFTDAGLPSAVYESCGDKYTRIFTGRPCPMERDAACMEPAPPGPSSCNVAPASVISPPFTAALVGCEHQIYTGPACMTHCQRLRYCRRQPDVSPDADDVTDPSRTTQCPFGLLTTVGSHTCSSAQSRGTMAAQGALESCPTAPPKIDYAAERVTAWDSCVLSIRTGAPCDECAH